MPPPPKRLDIQSLVCLEALVAARSVTRAAEQMGMSQPGMSNALAKLRRLLGDPLLVSTTQGMVPTPRAIELARSIREGLQFFDVVLADHGPFNSATASGTVTLATTDYAGLRVFPRLIARLAREAPGISINLKLPDPKHIREWLEEGECDLAVGHFPQLPASMRSSVLLDEPLVCIARRGHAAIGPQLTVEQYAAAGHVIFGSPFSPISTLESTVRSALARLGIERNVGVRIASLLLSAQIVSETDLIATMGRGLAEHHARTLPIALYPVPFEAPGLSMSLVWHERTHQSSLHRWIRQVLREVNDEVHPPSARAAGLGAVAPALASRSPGVADVAVKLVSVR